MSVKRGETGVLFPMVSPFLSFGQPGASSVSLPPGLFIYVRNLCRRACYFFSLFFILFEARIEKL